MLYLYSDGNICELVARYGIEFVVGPTSCRGVQSISCDELKDALENHSRVLLSSECPPPSNFPAVEIGEKGEKILHFQHHPLEEKFFKSDARDVAIELLGKIIIRESPEGTLMGKIVETEAYYGAEDPASRAYRGEKNYNRGMWLPGGHIFVYMVHANWMFNITTDENSAQAVLIRAVEPLAGLDIMREKRRKDKIRELCSGPGKWTQAFGIHRDMNMRPLGNEIKILESPWKVNKITRKHRIGVRKDLPEPLRFYISENRFVSKR